MTRRLEIAFILKKCQPDMIFITGDILRIFNRPELVLDISYCYKFREIVFDEGINPLYKNFFPS